MDYFEKLEHETKKLYKIAEEARSKGLDVTRNVEVPLAKDLAERVEGLVGPKGVAKRIKELEKEYGDRDIVAFKLAAEIASQKIEVPPGEDEIKLREPLTDQGLRTALAILTEGVVAAPLEGISQIKLKKNLDGSDYLAVYFAGPIRSAGGTAAALSVLLGDYIRRAINISEYKPTDDEIERYVEEVELYESEVTNLQYSPKPDEVRLASKNIPVEVSGEPTDKIEVSHRDLPRVETNNIRGGALLAMVEGVIQKAPKVLKYANTLELDKWDWLAQFSKSPKASDDGDKKIEVKADDKYMQDIIAGRPVLSYPSEKGGFRLRYGRSRNTGLAAMGVHPATMELMEFLAVGTQMKIERPGKGNCACPVDSIEGPIVKLKNGDVVKIETIEEARKLRHNVDEILFMGDMLVAFGEFLRNNHVLMPSAWCIEWWIKTIENSENYNSEDLSHLLNKISAKEAFKLSKTYNVPLHPDYTYNYHDVSIKELNYLYNWICNYENEYVEGKPLLLDLGPEKRILEVLGICHTVEDSKINLSADTALTLMNTLNAPLDESGKNTLDELNKISPIKIMAKSPTYIGTRIGRPEKTKERRMKPAPHSLFPIGNYGGSRRNILEAVKKGQIDVELSRAKCTKCQISSFQSLCPHCGAPTEITASSNKKINIANLFRKASANVGVRRIDEVKGVLGMISESKFPEPLEKGILRAKNEVFTFKDATIRHDSTDLPLTHFIPEEVGATVEKLLKMGYTHDCYGEPLKNADQIVELKVQDVVVSEHCGKYLTQVAEFIDDLLETFYEMDRAYNVKDRFDLIGHLIVGLAPHTSAGVLGRIVGFTKASACYAHPYFHSAKRRNCDSDEDSVMLLLDALLNFSKSYLPSTRGGSMDAPLVLSSRIDPEEIDDESHKVDTMDELQLEFFERTLNYEKPGDVLDLIDNVKNRLGTPAQYEGLMFSHNTSSIHAGPKVCLYKTLPSMKEKVESQIQIAEKIRAVDQKGVVKGVLSSHFLPDMMGNVRAFSKQKVRCTKCGSKYRRVPLSGKCACGSNLILSVSKGSVTKYLDISKDLVKRYPIDPYIVQRLEIQEFGINSLFESDKSKQSSLDIFL